MTGIVVSPERTGTVVERSPRGLTIDLATARAARYRALLPSPDEARLGIGGAAVRVTARTGPAADAPAYRATLSLGGMRVWATDSDATLRSESGRVTGDIGLESRRAEIALAADADGRDAADVVAAVSASSALLLGRLGRALVHAAAIVAPDGRAWLLVGDSRSGKSSTVATLIAAGWDYLSDDQVVLSPDERTGRCRVDAWRETFRLDRGWAYRAPTGDRVDVDATTLGDGRWRCTAPLGGVLLPHVEPDARTTITAIAGTAIFAALVRQSPWLLADRTAAGAIVSLLETVALKPAARLRLGFDSYAAPGRLTALLRRVVTA